MCGIAGFFGKGNDVILKAMTETLRHRGPDDLGIYYQENVGFGHTRLSIIDLSQAGHQPMKNVEGTIYIIFNGEMYNFLELKKKIIDKYNFRSKTDTEVILCLYEEYGEDCFSMLDGMFAIAIYDKRKNKILLARDRMGKKPLYWTVQDGTLIFGSELKALLKHPSFKKEIDFNSLNKYLTFEYVPTPHSIYNNVYKLEPGYFLEYDGKNIKKKKYWDIEFGKEKFDFLNINKIVEELDERFDNAVKKRMVSDVPLGVFLSGGIDSSSIAYYAQKNSKNKIKTFSIGFKEESFDESSYARQVSNFLGTEHYEKKFEESDLLDIVPIISDMLDEPMADPSIIPTFLLSKFTRQNITVALAGDGGDELFMGYDTFVAHRVADIYEKIPEILRKKIIEKIIPLLPTSHKNISLDFKAKQFISGFYGDKRYRDIRWLGSFNKTQKEKLFIPEIEKILIKSEYDDIDNYIEKSGQENFYNQLIYLYLKMYLMDDILVKADRASMFNSLEIRSPLLDYKLVDFINSIPIDLKFRGIKTKYIFKKLMEDKLPKEIVYRKKKGFGIPIAEWFSGELKNFIKEILNKEKIENQGIFNYKYIDKLLNDHFSKKKDNRKLIWTLIIFQMWQEKWFR